VVQAATAVAAVAVAVVLATHLGGGRQAATSSERAGGAGTNAPAAAGPNFGAAAIPTNSQSLTAKTFTALAGELANEARRQPADKLSSGSKASPSPNLSPSTTDLAIACMQQATGVVAGSSLYYFQGAYYEGEPSYIGAFVSQGQNPGLLVVAVAIDGCRPLNIIREKL